MKRKNLLYIGVATIFLSIIPTSNSEKEREPEYSFAESQSSQSEVELLKNELSVLQNERDKLLEKISSVSFELQNFKTQLDIIENENEQNILSIIRSVCNQRGFDYNLAYAVAIHESGLNPNACGMNTDGTQDHGLYQFNDITLECFEITKEDIYNPATATAYFCALIENNLEKYDGDLYYVLRCYQAGETGAKNGGGYTFANDIMKMLGGSYG